jgi:hypothetical protein
MSKSSGLVNVFMLMLPFVCWWWCCCCLFLWQWTTVSSTTLVAVVAVAAVEDGDRVQWRHWRRSSMAVAAFDGIQRRRRWTTMAVWEDKVTMAAVVGTVSIGDDV